MTAILGISAWYHDAAAALVAGGEIVAAAQEERFSRVKHDPRFPRRAVEACLDQAGLDPGAVDYVVFYDKPVLKFGRILDTWLATAPRGFRAFARALPVWLSSKLHLPREMRRALRGAYRKRFVFTAHHEAHAASAFFPSPFSEAAVLTLDGVGEWATATGGTGRGGRIEILEELRFPHSAGLLYSAFTGYLGFRVNSGEYKVMGLAPYGKPRYAGLILDKLLDLREDGSFRLDLSYFDYPHGLRMTSRRFHRLFGGPPRRPDEPLEERHRDLAASIQRVTEEIVLRAARHLHARTGMRNLCLAGGVALNCVANGRLLREGPFERIWVQPAAGDAGGALGAALFVWHQLLGQPRPAGGGDRQKGSLLGPEHPDAAIRSFLDRAGARYDAPETEEELLERTADLLARGRVVGWFQGRMEFGPRALGARSILADPRDPGMRDRINGKVKFRESFRPFAPAVLREHAPAWFDLDPETESPYMLLAAPVRASRRREIPAVTHVDGSARLQTVDEARHGRFARLLARFHARTGCPVLLNTSFNVRGEPIVCTPEDAWKCYRATGLDALVLGGHVLEKEREARP